MAKSQIGAIIGVEGASEYRRQINECVVATKNLASATKLVEASFAGQTKTIADLAKQKTALKGQIVAVGEKLALQRAELSKVVEAYKNGDENALKYKDAMIKLATETNKTETELYQLEQKLNDLPADSFIGKLQLIKENLQNNTSELKQWGDLLTDVGKALTIGLTVPITGLMGASVKAATDWESALNGVRKTTDMTVDEMGKLEDALKDEALQTTYTSTELANIAQIAGQLGVRGVDDIMKFVRVVSDLGISTDMTAEEAATSLARIFNITEGGDLTNLEKIGSVIVHLGNNLATTEPEITAMANRMASAASIVGFTTSEIFALSGALTSVGITAEAGGSTVGQVLTNIDKQVAQFTKDGTGNLERIAQISNMSASEFTNAWKNEPVKAFEAFINGLAALDDGTENINVVLDDLDMAGIRQSNMLKALAQAQAEGTDTTKLFTEALRLADEAFIGINENGEEFNALEKEANVRRNESATSFANLKEALSQLAQAFGEELLPIIVPFIEKLTDMIKGFSEMDGGTKKLILAIAGILAVLGPALTIIGTILSLMASAAVVATTLGGGIAALVAPIAAVVVGIGAFIAALIAIISNWEEISSELQAGFEVFVMIVKEIGNRILEFAVNLASDIWNRFTTFINDVLTWVSTMFERLVANVILGGVNLINRVKNIGSDIQSFFSGLISNAWNWGKDLMGNLISGITSKISSLVNSVKNVANTIWSYLHFSEPEKGALADFHTWMPDMMKGLAEGIEDNMYLVDHAINDVASTLSGGTNVNYGGVVINLNVPQGANGQQILNEIETELANRTIRRRAVFG